MKEAFNLAARQIGLNETDQVEALTEYLANGGVNLDPAVTAWCAAFVNATLEQTGQTGTGSLAARSFLNWGEEVDEPQPGDIAVFSRGDPNGWQGHVGFFEGYNPDGTIRVLGGNQRDAVNTASYAPDRLLGFRRFPGQPSMDAPQEAPQAPQTVQAVQEVQPRERLPMPSFDMPSAAGAYMSAFGDVPASYGITAPTRTIAEDAFAMYPGFRSQG